MNLLLTGGKAYIASHATEILIQAGYKAVLLNNLANNDISVLNRLEKINYKKIFTKF